MMAANEWYYRLLGMEFGPVTEDVLRQMVAAGTISLTDEVRCNAGDWRKLSEVPRRRSAGGSQQNIAAVRQPAVAVSSTQQWFYSIDDRIQGPVDLEELKQLSQAGRLSPQDRVREGLDGRWFRAATVPQLFADLSRSRSVTGQAALLAREPVPTALRATTPRPPAAAPLSVPRPRNTVTPPAKVSATASVKVVVPTARLDSEPRPHVTPAAPHPSFTPPRTYTPPRARSSFDWSSLVRGESVKKGLVAIALLGVAIGLWFGGDQIASAAQKTASPEFMELGTMWTRVVDSQEMALTAEQQAAMQSELLPKLDDLESRLAAPAAGEGPAAEMAQQMLIMVGKPAGPGATGGLLRRLLAGDKKTLTTDFAKANELMVKLSSRAYVE